MHVFMTGATGFLGRAVVLRLLRDGHRVSAWVRSPERARAVLGPSASLVPIADGSAALARAIERADAVINLAGESIFGVQRWTARRRNALVDSRVGVTDRLVKAICAARRPPKVLVSASAVGIYGDHGDTWLDEASQLGTDFVAEMCKLWEDAAFAATEAGTRVAAVRIGVVLGLGGGVLDSMMPIARTGLAGPLGSGNQFVPWIHINDLAEMFVSALTDKRMRGVIAGVAPEPVTNRALIAGLAARLNRPAVLRVPETALKLALGDSAHVILASNRIRPRFLQDIGFEFQFPSLDDALDDLLDDGCTFGPPDSIPRCDYLRDRRPRYLMKQVTTINAPVTDVFAFFSRAENLSLITPPALSFQIVTPTPIAMAPGATIDYRIGLGRVSMRWRTVIEDWQPGRLFVDSQHRGPYRSWWHEHHFTALGERTVMEDRVYYAPPLGPLGRVANRLLIARKLRDIFSYRSGAIGLRFDCLRRAHEHAA